jgi:hypothetical protein
VYRQRTSWLGLGNLGYILQLRLQLDAIFYIPNWIVQTEVHGKLLDKDRKVSVPSWNRCRVIQIGSEPLLSSFPKIRNHEKHFVVIGREILCAFSKMKIALGEEWIKFGWIGPVKGVQVLEIQLCRTRSCGLSIPNVDSVPKRREGLNKQSLVGIQSSGLASRTCQTTITTSTTTSTWGTR